MRQNNDNSIATAAKVLSDPIRLKILILLKEGRQLSYQAPVCSDYPIAVCPEDLRFTLENMSPSKLSYHLKELKVEGFISECKEGKRIYYFINPDRFKLLIESLSYFS